MPVALQQVQMIDNLCQRWHSLPSALLAEDAGLVYGVLGVLAEAEGGAASHQGPAAGEEPSMEETLAALSREI
jgi:hypothetical protein